MTSRLASALLLALVTGCGKTVPPPKPAPPRAVAEEPVAAEPQAETVEVVPTGADAEEGGPMSLRWSRQAPPFTGGLVVGRAHVAAIASDTVRLLERRTGRVAAELELRDVVPGGFALVGDASVIAVRRGYLEKRAIPGAINEAPVTVPLATTAVRASFSHRRFAVAYEDGMVRVYDRASLDPVRELKVDGEVATLALTKERLALGLESGDLALLDLETGDVQRHRVTLARGVDVLVPAPDGRLFVGAGPKVGIWSDEKRTLSPRLRHVSGVVSAAWLRDGTVATVGRDGLLILDPATGAMRSLGGGITGTQAGEAVAADAMGRLLCAAEAGGRVTCYGQGGAATRQIANPTPGRAGQRTLTATVVERFKKRLEIQVPPGGDLPAKDALVRLYRFREVTIGKTRSGRWIDTTEGKVRSVDGDRIEIRIGALRNADGMKEPLVAGVPVQLVWTPAPKAAPAPPKPGDKAKKTSAKE